MWVQSGSAHACSCLTLAFLSDLFLITRQSFSELQEIPHGESHWDILGTAVLVPAGVLSYPLLLVLFFQSEAP